MSLPRYPKYKDSGVEWLGRIPTHWTIDRFKHSVESCKNGIWGDDAKQNADDIPCVRVADFDRRRLRVQLDAPTIRNITERERTGRILRQGDLLLEKSGGGESQPVGCVVLYDDALPAVCSNFVARVKVPSSMNASFWRYVHAAAYTVRLNTRSIKQTSGIQNLDQQQYLDELAAFPPLGEQTSIAAFLDRETAKIDALVAEQDRLIELLKEKRQAVISHAVTKGLNPDVPMKDSGIEWVGQVPSHWAPIQVGRVCRDIGDGPHFSPPYVDEGVLFLSARNVKVDCWALDDVKYVSEADCREFDKRIVPEPGDVLYTKGGTTGVARVVDLEQRFQVWVHIAVLKVRKDLVTPHYLAYALNSIGCYEQSQLLTRGATNNDLGLTRMTKIWFGLPPLAEQRAIVEFLEGATSRLDTLTAEAQRGIDLLQERRTALISAAVTGQIDVREAAGRAA